MTTVRVLAAGAVSLTGCGLFQDSQLEITAGSGEAPVHTAEWPWPSGETVTVNNSVADSAGLAGLEVEVFLPGGPDITLRASDFDGRRNLTYGPILIGRDSGEARIFARLRRHRDGPWRRAASRGSWATARDGRSWSCGTPTRATPTRT